MQPVGVLRRVDQLEHGVLVDALGQRKLHDEPGHARVGVEVGDRGAHIRLARRAGQVDAHRLDADLERVAVLAADVAERAGVVADQQGREPGLDALALRAPRSAPSARP